MTSAAIGSSSFTDGIRVAILALILGLLSACGGSPSKERAEVTAAPGDWSPHITEASQRFKVPEEWIRAVMEVESGGRTHLRGRPITSHAGAMGLMQVMPATYQELRQAHNLGPDPHDPRDNILAGTAYLRQMYDQYGFPGFLGAYNAGPGRYGQHVTRGRQLPRETRNYMARIEPMIAHVPHPDRYDYDTRGRGQVAAASTAPSSSSSEPSSAASRSSPSQATSSPPVTTAANTPSRSSAGTNTTRPAVASADSSRSAANGSTDTRPYWSASSSNTRSNGAVTPAVATTSTNGDYTPSARDSRVLVASFDSGAAAGGQATSGDANDNRTDVIARWANSQEASSANASGNGAGANELDRVSGPGWGVQVGAFRTEEQGLNALREASRTVPGLGNALEQVTAVTTSDGTSLYRARLIGLSPDRAADACVALNRNGAACMLVTPS